MRCASVRCMASGLAASVVAACCANAPMPSESSDGRLKPAGDPFAQVASELLVVADLDGDQKDELILSRKVFEQDTLRYVIDIRDHTGHGRPRTVRLPADRHPGDHAALDVDGDGDLEISVSYVVQDSLYLVVYDDTLGVVAAVPVLGKEDSPSLDREGMPAWSPGTHPKATLDCNNDGHPEILCVGGAGYWLQPRGVWAVDWYHRKVLWHYPTGTVTSGLNVVRDAKGSPWIVVGSYSADNGAICNETDTDDGHSYLFILTPQGEPKHVYSLANRRYTQTRLVLLREAGGAVRLVTVTACGDLRDPVPATFRAWDGVADSVVRWTECELIDTDLEHADVDGDGWEELLLATQTGELAVYDQEFSLRRRIPTGYDRMAVRAVGDMDLDGHPEVVVGRGRGCFLINPRTSTIEAFLEGHDAKAFVRHGPGTRPTLYALRTREPWASYRIGRARTAFLWPAAAVLVVLAGVGAALLSGAARRPELPASQWKGSAIVDRRGRILAANRTLATLLRVDHSVLRGRSIGELLDGPGPDSSRVLELLGERGGPYLFLSASERRPALRVQASTIRGGAWSRSLIEAEEWSIEPPALAWTSMVPRIAHDLKSPLCTLVLSTEKAIRASDSTHPGVSAVSESIEAVLHQVERLELIARNFLKLSDLERPTMALVDILDLLTESLRNLRQRVPEGVSVEDKTERPLHLVWGDAEQLLTAFDNLYENSLTAVQDDGSIVVSAYRVASIPGRERSASEGVAIETSDTGVGITPKDTGHIFEPGFSTKPRGSGLGLAIVKKVIDQHHGHIEVHSEPNVGTTFTIYLPAARRTDQ
jgi:signal transduction histidine kinase